MEKEKPRPAGRGRGGARPRACGKLQAGTPRPEHSTTIQALQAKGIDPHVVQVYQVLERLAFNLDAESPFWDALYRTASDLLCDLDVQAELAPALGPDWNWQVDGDPPCETCEGATAADCRRCYGLPEPKKAVADNDQLSALILGLAADLAPDQQDQLLGRTLETADDQAARGLLADALGDGWTF